MTVALIVGTSGLSACANQSTESEISSEVFAFEAMSNGEYLMTGTLLVEGGVSGVMEDVDNLVNESAADFCGGEYVLSLEGLCTASSSDDGNAQWSYCVRRRLKCQGSN